jgi:DNA polymerase elongation subunit (family B)
MIISHNNSNIYISWRENGTKHSSTIPFRPYFFVEETSKEPTTYQPSKYITREIEYERGDWVNLKGTRLKKVYAELPEDLRNLKNTFSRTYEADVPYTYRYCVDRLEEIKEYDMRKWYWDMEWQQGGEHHDEITTIVMYDNYDKEYHQWAWFPDQGPYVYHPYTDKSKNLFVFRTEEKMIESFLTTMIEKDPDMLIAWFGNWADLPKLFSRCAFYGIDPSIISPLGVVDGIKVKDGEVKFTKEENGYHATAQPIRGRITLNLDMAFERQWNDAQKGTLPSLSLDYVSTALFGEGKSKETKFDDANEFYRRGWLEDTQAYLKYALIDVELLVKIDETNFCSEAILSLQRLLIAPFDACFFASNMGSIYFMRNAWWKAPTGEKPKFKVCDKCSHKNPNEKTLRECKKCGASLSYSGAMIYNPTDEGTNGLHYNVAAFDFAGLYPSMIIARNISFETLTEEPTLFSADLNTPQNLQPVAEDYEKDMRYFKTDKLGLLPRSLIDLKELRGEYKKYMKEARKAGDKEAVVKWNNNQMAVKRLMASFYGILAFKGFGWANVDLAASITASAREAIRKAAFTAREMKI